MIVVFFLENIFEPCLVGTLMKAHNGVGVITISV